MVKATKIKWAVHTEKTGCSLQATPDNSKPTTVSINRSPRVVLDHLKQGADLRHALLILMESNMTKKGIFLTYHELRESLENYLGLITDTKQEPTGTPDTRFPVPTTPKMGQRKETGTEQQKSKRKQQRMLLTFKRLYFFNQKT